MHFNHSVNEALEFARENLHLFRDGEVKDLDLEKVSHLIPDDSQSRLDSRLVEGEPLSPQLLLGCQQGHRPLSLGHWDTEVGGDTYNLNKTPLNN